jgi:TetR/AcrR family transcriptional repressor of nem operon
MAVFLTIRSITAIILAMARPKEFDRDVALRRAIPVFWKKGFARTSTEDLVAAMGIGKQSLYDTFGDKRGLFLEALRTYNSEGVASLVKRVAGGASRITAIEGVLVELANEQPNKRALGCMGVNSICELGNDEDVRAVSTMAASFQETALTSLIEDAKQQGEVSDAVDARAAARFLAAILSGMKVQAKAGASVEALRDVAAFAVRGLRRQT